MSFHRSSMKTPKQTIFNENTQKGRFENWGGGKNLGRMLSCFRNRCHFTFSWYTFTNIYLVFLLIISAFDILMGINTFYFE